MRFKSVGNKRDNVFVVIKNGDSITISAGAPVMLGVTGTDDGLVAKSSGSLGAEYSGFLIGLAVTDIAANAFGEAAVFGFVDNVRVALRSRAASTDSWATRPAIAIGDVMTAFQNTTALQGISRLTAGATSNAQPDIIAGFTKASAATLASGGTTSDASTTADGRMEYVTTGKVFLRCM